MIPRLLHELWLCWRKPYSVAIVGSESGLMTTPLDFLRFKTYADAAAWILRRELSAHPSTRLTQFVVVDLRQVEQLEHH